MDYAFIVTQNLAAQVQAGINFSTGGIPGGQIGLGFSWVKL